MRPEQRGCLLAVGWTYVVGLFLVLLLVAWEAISSGLKYGLGWDSLGFLPLAIVWPLAIVALGGGHGSAPMSFWARVILLPLVSVWIALGWWAMISTYRRLIKQRREPRIIDPRGPKGK